MLNHHKTLDEIQQIVISIKVLNFIKQVIGARTNLILIAKKKQLERTVKSKPSKNVLTVKRKVIMPRIATFLLHIK